MCTFLCWMEHCGIWKRCFLGFVNQINCGIPHHRSTSAHTNLNVAYFLYCRTPGLSWDWETSSGVPYAYDSVGAACSEVEIDCLTGDHAVRLEQFNNSLANDDQQYSDVLMSATASQITGVPIVCPTVCIIKKTSRHCVTGLCERNPPVTGGFPSQRASN